MRAVPIGVQGRELWPLRRIGCERTTPASPAADVLVFRAGAARRAQGACKFASAQSAMQTTPIMPISHYPCGPPFLGSRVRETAEDVEQDARFKLRNAAR